MLENTDGYPVEVGRAVDFTPEATVALNAAERLAGTPGQRMERAARWISEAAAESPLHSDSSTPLEAAARIIHSSERGRTAYAASLLLSSEAEKLTFVSQLAGHVAQAARRGNKDPRRQMLLVARNQKAAAALVRGRQNEMLHRVAPWCSIDLPPKRGWLAKSDPDVLAIGQERLPEALQDGRVSPNKIGLVVYDSGDEAPNPDTLSTIGESVGATCMHVTTGTETPLPVIRENKLTEAIQQGALNGVQLYTFRVMRDTLAGTGARGKATLHADDAYNRQVMTGIAELVRTGRRVAVFCQDGFESAHAKRIAQMLSEQELTVEVTVANNVVTCEPRPIAADIVSQAAKRDGENNETVRKLCKGELDVIAGGAELTDGNGVFADALVIANGVKSPDTLRSLVANAVAANPRFPHTVIMEFVPLQANGRLRTSTVHDLFGHSIIEQGVTIGGYLDPLHHREAQPAFQLPDTLSELAATLEGKRVWSATIGAASEAALTPAIGRVSFATLRQGREGYGDLSLRNYLRAAGYASESRVEMVDGKRTNVMWYPEEAKTYLEQNPLPPLPQPGEMNVGQIAAMFDAFGAKIYIAIAKNRGWNVEFIDRFQRGRVEDFLNAASTRRVITELFHPPTAAASDMALAELEEVLGCGPAFILDTLRKTELKPTPKFAPEPQEGCYLYLDETSSNMIVQAYLQLPEADDDDIALTSLPHPNSCAINTLVTRTFAEYADNIIFKRVPGGYLALPYIKRSLVSKELKQVPDPQPITADLEDNQTEEVAEPSDMRSTELEQELEEPGSWGYTPGATLGNQRPSTLVPGQMKLEEAIKTPVPPELLVRDSTQVTLRGETPGSWQPKAPAKGHFLSVTETLSVVGVAARLGISQAGVTEALTHLESSEPPNTEALTGKTLLLLRQQLLGIPLEYLSRAHNAPPVKIIELLADAGYTATDENRYSPGAAAYLEQHVDDLKK